MGNKHHVNAYTILTWILILCGVILIAYPSVANVYNTVHQSHAIAGYEMDLSDMTPEDYTSYWDDLHAYNETLVKMHENQDDYLITPESHQVYMNTLNVSPLTGIIGYVEIPVLNVKLPIYHTTDDSVLQSGVGHMEGSSLPGGGENTHCVLSGHRGLPSSRLFTYLPKMKVGDKFYLFVLDDVLTYQVTEVITALPEEMKYLEIEEGKDLCTLMTCTPYGVNSHRLLVRGNRIATIVEDEEEQEVPVEPTVHPILDALLPMFYILAALIMVGVFVYYLNKKRTPKQNEKREE